MWFPQWIFRIRWTFRIIGFLANYNLDRAYALSRWLWKLPDNKFEQYMTEQRALRVLNQNRRICEAVKVQYNKCEGIYCNLGIAVDAFDGFPDPSEVKCVLRTATHFKCSLEEAIREYEIVLTPHPESFYHGLILARRIYRPSPA